MQTGDGIVGLLFPADEQPAKAIHPALRARHDLAAGPLAGVGGDLAGGLAARAKRRGGAAVLPGGATGVLLIAGVHPQALGLGVGRRRSCDPPAGARWAPPVQVVPGRPPWPSVTWLRLTPVVPWAGGVGGLNLFTHRRLPGEAFRKTALEVCMFSSLPPDTQSLMQWSWAQIEPYYADLAARPLNSDTLHTWLLDWSRLHALVHEVGTRLRLAHDLDTTDQAARQDYFRFVETIEPAIERVEHTLRQKLLDSEVHLPELELPLRNLRALTALFREENLPLFAEEHELVAEYGNIMGTQTFPWEGQELPMPELYRVLEDPDRDRRERAWRLARQRQLADRDRLNRLWQQLLTVRQHIAANAGHADYRTYIWQAYLRLDYTPADCLAFHHAVEAVCVPAAVRLYERRRRQLGVATLRPWDLANGYWGRPVAGPGLPPLRPYRSLTEFLAKAAVLFHRVDPQLSRYFRIMVDEQLLDVDNRPGKAPGGYCAYLAAARRPFIFMNAVGLHSDVQTLIHEAGHAFYEFEKSHLPYHIQWRVPIEFDEVAAMAMELLAAPYLSASGDGFYTEAEAARARAEHLEDLILSWPYIAVVDSFQHWAYTHPDEAADPAQCDTHWLDLWQRFCPVIDWSGLDGELIIGWQRRQHLFQLPFYYIEYGLAALGAVQVWRNALDDHTAAVARYRQALALGGTRALPHLFAVAGARFAFDADMLGQAVALIEGTIADTAT